MNLLVLKALVYDPVKETFRSPSEWGFTWPRQAVVSAACRRHKAPGKGCSCGLYGSSSVEIIQSYISNPLAVVFLMNTYGDVHVRDLGVRAWGMRPVGVANTNVIGVGIDDLSNMGDRQAAIMAASEYFLLPDGAGLSIYPLEMVFRWIESSWDIHVWHPHPEKAHLRPNYSLLAKI